jgi:hypothetical protein
LEPATTIKLRRMRCTALRAVSGGATFQSPPEWRGAAAPGSGPVDPSSTSFASKSDSEEIVLLSAARVKPEVEASSPYFLAASHTRLRGHFYGFKAIASANRRDFKMERRVFGMAALIQHRLRSFVFLTDLCELRPNQMRLPKVGAEPALPVIYVNHADLQVNGRST